MTNGKHYRKPIQSPLLANRWRHPDILRYQVCQLSIPVFRVQFRLYIETSHQVLFDFLRQYSNFNLKLLDYLATPVQTRPHALTVPLKNQTNQSSQLTDSVLRLDS